VAEQLPEGGEGMSTDTANPETAVGTAAETAPQEQPAVCGYVVSQSGVFAKIKDKSGEIKNVWLCSEINVEACTRDDQQGDWGRLLVFRDPDGHVHRFNAQMRLLSSGGDGILSELMGRGLHVAQGLGTKRLIIDFFQSSTPSQRARTVNKTGWHGEQFVLPEQVIGTGTEMLLYQQESLASHAYRCQGSLLEWQQQVARPCVGNSRLVLAVSTAFAAPLLQYVNGESGGISITGGSSTGKTTALYVATSVCGSPDYLQRWRATSNGLESVATLHNDTLLVLDELGQIDSKEVGETAYMLANGAGKIRATKSGGARGKATWKLLFLSAGEVTLVEHMAAAGKHAHAGQEIRMVDVPADAGKGKGLFEHLHGHPDGGPFADALKFASSRFYGTPLVEYLNKLTREEPYIINNQLDAYQQQFMERLIIPGAGGQVRRVASRFALIAAGGELASSLGVTGWEAGEAINAAVSCFNGWVESRDGTGQQEHRRMMEQVSDFIERHGSSRFSPYDDDNLTTKTINRAGFREYDAINDTFIYNIFPGVWKDEVCKGFNGKVMSTFLRERGVLMCDKKGNPYTTKRMGSASYKCYAINGAAFTQDQEAVTSTATVDIPPETCNIGNTGNIVDPADDIPF
jgi:putative DNA primase/helicase